MSTFNPVGPSSRHAAPRAADVETIREAADSLLAGRLVAFPTETVYGLGADARSGTAVAGIYRAKDRPRFNPLIAHVASREAAFDQGRFDDLARRLAAAFWPGPLTLVVPASDACTVSDLARAGLPTVALRVPDHPVASALLAAAAIPVAAPSANRSGRISPTRAGDVAAELGDRCAMILDGGPTRVGLESTIVASLDGEFRMLRPGGIPRDAIERVLGRPLSEAGGGPIVAPGMLVSHYAPTARVRLDATSAAPDEGILDFGGRIGPAPASARYLDLSATADLAEAAANLFGFLRRLDAEGVGTIAVASIPAYGLGEAIKDRLARAAAARG